MLTRNLHWPPVLVLALLCGLSSSAQPSEPDERQALSPPSEDSRIQPIHESITIVAEPAGPLVQPRLAEILSKTLITRDDQVLQILGAGINGGQHEGGGKSLEIRRYGFNLDHGGAGGGLRVTVDNVAQNHGTQGHGQGYLGALKSLSPELIEDVTLVNGPFRAEHGDFSGLGVVQIRLRESLPEEWTFKVQGGSYDSLRTFFAWSPNLDRREALIAYESSHSDGPFLKPLGYVRHNVTADHVWKPGNGTQFGVKLNGGLNRFNSSGQIPTDEVAAGRLDRFGSLSPGDGGDVQQGRIGAYVRKDFRSSASLRADAFVERSLFDLYSNFTFNLVDPIFGDAIQQHDSRLSQGGDVKYERPSFHRWGASRLSAGGAIVTSQNLVDLRRSPNRNPVRLITSADASVINSGVYLQEQVDLARGRLQLTGGLRYDSFRFATVDHLEPQFSLTETEGKLQPKAAVAFTPWADRPLRLFYNYGRGIASMDARGVARRPDSPHISTTDFQQIGIEHLLLDRWSVMADMFLIRQSNQLVYIPDDGTIDFAEPSRSHGYEVRTSVDLTSKLGLSASVTKVLNAYFANSEPRLYLERAPSFVAEGSIVLADWRKWSGSLRMRAINHYRLAADDPAILAAGHTVFDVAASRRISPMLDLYVAADNLLDREYWETQNFFASRLPGQDAMDRIHATPSFGRTLVVGVTWKLSGS